MSILISNTTSGSKAIYEVKEYSKLDAGGRAVEDEGEKSKDSS
jgi:hypothetical protein